MPDVYLRETFGIVVIPPDRDPDGAFGVWLMKLNSEAEPDFEQEEFVLARTRTHEAAVDYAKGLSDLLKLVVFEIQKAK